MPGRQLRQAALAEVLPDHAAVHLAGTVIVTAFPAHRLCNLNVFAPLRSVAGTITYEFRWQLVQPNGSQDPHRDWAFVG